MGLLVRQPTCANSNLLNNPPLCQSPARHCRNFSTHALYIYIYIVETTAYITTLNNTVSFISMVRYLLHCLWLCHNTVYHLCFTQPEPKLALTSRKPIFPFLKLYVQVFLLNKNFKLSYFLNL